MWQFMSQVSDLHGENDIHKITAKSLRNKNLDLTEKDYLIICGDFGLVWHYPETKGYETDQYWLNWLANKPWTTLFVDGNHENFDLLETFPIEKWNGGNVHHIVKNKVIHLMRGQIFYLEGKSIFTFGGAESHDKIYRTQSINWWPQELPKVEEENIGIKNLIDNKLQVDYIITHCAPYSFEDRIFRIYNSNTLKELFQMLYDEIDFKHWYCGHYHISETFDNITCLYNKIIPLGKKIDK